MANRVEQFMVIVDNKKVFFYKTKSGFYFMNWAIGKTKRISEKAYEWWKDYENFKHSDRQ